MKRIMNFVGIMVMVALIGVLLVLVAKKDDINEMLDVAIYTEYYFTLQDEFESDEVMGDFNRMAAHISAELQAHDNEDARMYVEIGRLGKGEDLGFIKNTGYKIGKILHNIVK